MREFLEQVAEMINLADELFAAHDYAEEILDKFLIQQATKEQIMDAVNRNEVAITAYNDKIWMLKEMVEGMEAENQRVAQVLILNTD